MAGRGEGPDFVESLARGLDACSVQRRAAADEPERDRRLHRHARRLLKTEELGFVRLADGQFSLTPRVSSGMAFVASL